MLTRRAEMIGSGIRMQGRIDYSAALVATDVYRSSDNKSYPAAHV